MILVGARQAVCSMGTTGKTSGAVQVGEGLDGLQRFWPLDDGVQGYGVAAYMSAKLIACRLYNLQSNELLAMLKSSGEYATQSGKELVASLTAVLDQLSEQAGIPLSKLTVAVVSGTTAMESKVSGLDSAELQHDLEKELGEFGRDVEYMFAGSSSIAVGQAFFVPCLDVQVGGDFFCSLLAIDILGSEKPLLFINADPHDSSNVALAYGSKGMLSVCAVPEGVGIVDAMSRLLSVCEAEYGHIEHALVTGDADVELPAQLRDRVRRVSEPAIEGASAVLLSEMAEDELCRIVSACQVVKL